MKNNKEVLVIGAGPGGLASAMLMAHAGCKVTVLERMSTVGGRTSGFGDNGYRFDLGPTFFLYPRVIEEIFRAVGYELKDEVEMTRLDPQYHLVFEKGGDIRATNDEQRMMDEIRKVAPQDADGFARYMRENREKLRRFRPILEQEFNSFKDVVTMDSIKALPLIRPHLSVDDDLGRFFSDERIRLAFSFQSKYLGMSPFKCPSLFTILAFLEYEHGVWHPTGGCHAVTQAMARIAEELGVTIKLNEPVEQVMFEGKKAVGARTTQDTYKADAVIMNADFAQAMKRMVPDNIRKRWTDAKIAKKKFSCSTFMMYLGVRGTFDHLEHHTIYLSKDYHQNLKDIDTNYRPPTNPSFYVQYATKTDPSLAPEGCSTLYCLAPVPHLHPNLDWDKEAAAFKQTFIKQLEKLNIMDLQDRIEYERIITPNDWQSEYEIYKGATFNLAHNLGQMLHARPRNRFEDLKNVYLTGGGTHPGSGLPVIFESARISTRLLAKDLGLDPQWDFAKEPLQKDDDFIDDSNLPTNNDRAWTPRPVNNAPASTPAPATVAHRTSHHPGQ